MKYKFRVLLYDYDEELIDELLIEARYIEDALQEAIKTDIYLKLETKISHLTILDPYEDIAFSPPLLELKVTDLSSYLQGLNSSNDKVNPKNRLEMDR